jgi:SAM-dependent methyltransferase
MKLPFEIYPLATHQNFDEAAYLLANQDVTAAVRNGDIKSGFEHFNIFGFNENRKLDISKQKEFQELKINKKAKIKPHLRKDMQYVETDDLYDFLTADLRNTFSIIDTTAVSSNNYDSTFKNVINSNELVLDCGAGSRQFYYDNVINFEIAKYSSTDVLGVGEVLPFKDDTFDAVLSNAVLEHVKNPWLCAAEILRVLKPGGELICCVPFLQPLHGYPHHYYNMSAQGLRNLFGNNISVVEHNIPQSTLPIWSLNWILNSWSAGLSGDTKDNFLQMRVCDLMEMPSQYLDKNFVTQLSNDKNFELASATLLRAKKTY